MVMMACAANKMAKTQWEEKKANKFNLPKGLANASNKIVSHFHRRWFLVAVAHRTTSSSFLFDKESATSALLRVLAVFTVVPHQYIPTYWVMCATVLTAPEHKIPNAFIVFPKMLCGGASFDRRNYSTQFFATLLHSPRIFYSESSGKRDTRCHLSYTIYANTQRNYERYRRTIQTKRR